MMTPEQSRVVSDLIYREYTADPELRVLRCNRCGEIVTWVTRHAAERHGDNIEVMPMLEPASVGLW